MRTTEANFIPHCEDGECDLGAFDYQCPSCCKCNTDYAVWWKQYDIMGGKPEVFKCRSCHIELIVRWNDHRGEHNVTINKIGMDNLFESYTLIGTPVSYTDNSLWYNFCDWKVAFGNFRLLEAREPGKFRMVISTNCFTSGYWIELVTAPNPNAKEDLIYVGQQVFDLEERVRVEIEETSKKEKRSPQFTI